MNMFFRVGSVVTFALLGLGASSPLTAQDAGQRREDEAAVSVTQQGTATAKRVKLSDELIREKRADVLHHINSLIEQNNASAKVLEKMKAEYDGSIEQQLRFHFFDLQILKDLGDIIPKMASSIEDLRWDIFLDLQRKQSGVKRHARRRGEVQNEIDALAAVIRAGKDQQGNPLSPTVLKTYKRRIYEYILHRDLHERARGWHSDRIEQYQEELKTLDEMEKQIGAEALTSAARAERLVETIGFIEVRNAMAEMEEGRELLQDALVAWSQRIQPPPLSPPVFEEEDLGRPLTMPKLPAVELDADAEKMVEEELRKAEERSRK